MALRFFRKKKTETDTSSGIGTEDLRAEQEQAPPDQRSEPVYPYGSRETASEDAPGPSETVVSPKPSPASENGPSGKPVGFFSRLKKGLSKTRKSLSGGLEKIFSGKSGVDDDLIESLEELLITSDVGVETTMAIMDRVSDNAAGIRDADGLKAFLKEEVLTFFDDPIAADRSRHDKPHVIMVVGVNGVGKTTTIGKLAARKTEIGEQVLIAAADTFRAAAVEQLTIWAERAGADIVKHKENADPAAVAFDAVDAALARSKDVVLIDTAGRLHTRVNLMEELKKIKRTISKRLPGAPHEILLILDATTGQNAISQAKLFNEALDVTGLALTKLDGTAKGGIVISICDRLGIPLRYIGVGEQVEDLQDFDPKVFVEALF